MNVCAAAYQSALLSTPLLLLRLFAALVGFWGFLQTLLTLALVGSACGMAYVFFSSCPNVFESVMELMIGDMSRFVAYRDANSGGLARYRLPYIGEYADRWVGDE